MELPFSEIRKIGKSRNRKGTDHDLSLGHVSLKWFLGTQMELSDKRWIYESGSQGKRSLDDITWGESVDKEKRSICSTLCISTLRDPEEDADSTKETRDSEVVRKPGKQMAMEAK